MATSAPELVVTARLLPLSYYNGGGGGGGGIVGASPSFYTSAPDMEALPPEQGPTDGSVQPPPTVYFEEGLSAAETAALNRFRLTVQSIHVKLGATYASQTIPSGSGTNITLSDIYSHNLWLNFKITLTTSYRTGAGGEVKTFADGSSLSSMRASTLTGYDAFGESGRNYLALHELSHTLPIATSFFNTQYQTFLAFGGSDANWESSANHAIAERYVNTIAKRLAEALGIPIMENPPHGYD
jgi:hypothetical protein